MSQKAIREHDGKKILSHWLTKAGVAISCPTVQVTASTDLTLLPQIPGNEWLLKSTLVVKPDQLIKRRGKSGLIGLNLHFDEVKTWITERMNQSFTIGKTTGTLDTFIIEPFVPHAQSDEYYIAIHSTRDHDIILFHHEGGVDIGDVDGKALSLNGPLEGKALDLAEVQSKLLKNIPDQRKPIVLTFITELYSLYQKLHFCYLEINPLVFNEKANNLAILDLAAKVDEAAAFVVHKEWSTAISQPQLDFPPPFGKALTKDEQIIHDLDAKTGASLKLTVLNPHGNIWTLVAGGGSSVVIADTISSLGFTEQLANYGEYSGAPSTEHTYLYAKQVLDLMTRPENNLESNRSPTGKVLIIAGAIANFTDIAATFKGIIQALWEYKDRLIALGTKIYVRRAGPNSTVGLQLMRDECKKMKLEAHIFGSEIAMTGIIPFALGLQSSPFSKDYTPKYVTPQPQLSDSLTLINGGRYQHNEQKQQTEQSQSTTPITSPTSTTSTHSSPIAQEEISIGKTADKAQQGTQTAVTSSISSTRFVNGFTVDQIQHPKITIIDHKDWEDEEKSTTIQQTDPNILFTPSTQVIVYGLQTATVQHMLDFDYINGRSEPSVKCLVYPFQGNHFQKFFWYNKEVLIPCYSSFTTAMHAFPQVDCVINFASFRSAYETTVEMLEFSEQLKSITIIAEGVPERQARLLLHKAKAKGVTIIGPATVGGIAPRCVRLGNSGGALVNIVQSKLFQQGSVAYCTRSGGLSNELNNILSQNTDGVAEGIAIGGDRYPGSTFTDHLLRFQANPKVKMMVLIGEVGGIEEYKVIELLEKKIITKPLIATCIGTIADQFTYDVQFGHAGATSGVATESASVKNEALRKAGAIVPTTFDHLGQVLNEEYVKLVENGTIRIIDHHVHPHEPYILPSKRIPMDYKWALKQGLIRRPTSFISTISDERGEELQYHGVKISDLIERSTQEGLHGIGFTLGLLWFKKQLPPYFAQFIELVIMLTADHGPAVSGALVTNITARAGKDLTSCLAAGLLTIGERWGGALNESSKQFYEAYKAKLTPSEFIQQCQHRQVLISGIGHKIKSVENPDARVTLLREFITEHISAKFPHVKFPILEFAFQVEQLTTKKRSNLILNVDGFIACTMVDLWLAHPDLFSTEDIEQYLDIGMMNGFFIIGRSIGLVGHYIDQNRLKQPLYRHSEDDILCTGGEFDL